jgi:dTDP-4-dehydrorhamnose reductase
LKIPVRELSIMRIVVTGASGQLGAYLLRDPGLADHHKLSPWMGRRAVDLIDADAVCRALTADNPDLVIHAAAIASALQVRKAPERGRAVNVEATRVLAAWCTEHGRRLVFTSTDMVFDGARGWYREDDVPHPILEYGRTKAAAEKAVLEVPDGLVARISLLYGLSRAEYPSFFDSTIERLEAGQPQAFFADEFRTPLHYATAANALVLLAQSDARGIVHVAGPERVSRHELMLRAAGALGLDARLIRANLRADVPNLEARPADLSLDTSRLVELLPDLERPSIETALRTIPR